MFSLRRPRNKSSPSLSAARHASKVVRMFQSRSYRPTHLRFRITSSTAVFLTTLGLASMAEAAPNEASCGDKPNAIVADLGLHVINVGYQRTLGCYVVAQSSAGLYGPWTVNSNVLGLGGGDQNPPGDVIGFVVRARAFVFPLGHAPGGLWISPYVQGGPVVGTRGGEKHVGPAFASGLSVGWTFRLGERVLLGLGLGGQYHRTSFAGSTARPGFALFGPTVDINVGVRF